MTADKIRATLVKRFRDNWNAEAPASLQLTRVAMPGQKHDRDSGEPSAVLSVQFGTRSNEAIGGQKIRQRGFLYLQVFLPEDSGTKVATDAYDAFAAIMDNQTPAFLDATGYVHLQAVTSQPTGTRPGYQQFTWAAPFYADDDR